MEVARFFPETSDKTRYTAWYVNPGDHNLKKKWQYCASLKIRFQNCNAVLGGGHIWFIFLHSIQYNSQQATVLKLRHRYDIFINCNWVVNPGGSSTVHIYTQTIRTTQITTNVEECEPCPVFASFTLAFALQLRKKHGKTTVRVRKTSVRVQYTYYQNTHTLQNHIKPPQYKLKQTQYKIYPNEMVTI
jgi:hypothetical protein